MKKTLFALNIFAFVLLTSAFSSCGDGANVLYKTHMSQNKAYEVDIPIGYAEEYSIGDALSFTHQGTNVFLNIQELPAGQSLSSFASKNNKGRKYVYSVFDQSDTSLFYVIHAKSTNPFTHAMWTAYELYMKKRLDGVDYVISLLTDRLDKKESTSIISHIHNSLSAHSKKMEIIKDGDRNGDEGFTTRDTKYYSIAYPKRWLITLNPTQMSDVYLGDADGRLGCTVLFFDTDYSLYQLNEESNTSMKNARAKVIENKRISINGQDCYKAVYEFTLDDMDVKQISYTFKKGNTMYNVKFGNNKQEVNASLALIGQIIDSFKMK